MHIFEISETGGFFGSRPWLFNQPLGQAQAKSKVLTQVDNIGINPCMHGSVACFVFLPFLSGGLGTGLVWARSKHEW